MKHIKILFVFVFVIIYGCKTAVKLDDLKYLNGFWEIVKVEMPDGTLKEFKINETIDFIKFENNNGARTKVIPQLDGGFLSNNFSENFTVTKQDEIFLLEYKTDHSSWSEELIQLTEEELVVKNNNDLVYYYKKRTDLNRK